MYHKLGLVSTLLLLSLLLSSHSVQSQVAPPVTIQLPPKPPVPMQSGTLTPEQAWQKAQLPWDKMAICPPINGIITATSVPNFDSPACRVLNNGPVLSWQPGTARPDGGFTGSKMGPISPSEPAPVDATPIPTPTIKSSSIQSDPYRSWASNILNCASSCSVLYHPTSTYWVGSTNVPSLTCCGHGWWGYHYSVRTHIASSQTLGACTAGEYGNMSLGVGYGQFGPQAGGVRIFWEDYGGFNACAQYWDTQYTFASKAALYFALTETLEGGYYFWNGYVWIGSGWHQFFHNRALAYADIIDQGIELEANNGDKSTVLVPLAFAHKAMLITPTGAFPWDNPILPSYVQGKTTSAADSPWIVMDTSGTNFTSTAAETTYQ